MKLKGINPIEQHVEKVVVGLTGLVFLGVIAQQFLTQPNQVKVGDVEVPPQNAFEPVKQAATTLRARIESATPTLPEGFEQAGKDLGAEFQRLASGAVAPRANLAPFGPGLSLGGTGPTVAADVVYASVVLPTPGPAVAASSWHTIHASEVAAHPELAAFLPAEQPFDAPSVSVESTLDVKALLTSLSSDPDGAGPIEALPQGWWREAVEAVVVEAERQSLQSDGTWSAAEIVAPVAGRDEALKSWEASVRNTSDMQTQLPTLRQLGDSVLRPRFYRTLGGAAWRQPTVAAARAAARVDDNVTEQKRAELAKVQEDLAALRTELAALPAEQPRTPTTPSTPGSGPNRTPPNQPSGQQPGGAPNQPNVAANRNRLNNQIRALEGQERRLTTELAAAGGVATEVDAPIGGASLLSSESATFWLHDLSVKPGATYRYRLRLGVNNPLYGRQMLLKDTQRAEAEAAVLRTEWSAWSTPVEVDRDVYFFVTAAAGDDETSVARASAELFKFYFGYYRRQNTGMQIGDVLQGEVVLPKGLSALAEQLARADASSTLAGPEGAATPQPPSSAQNPGQVPSQVPGQAPGQIPGQAAGQAPGQGAEAAPALSFTVPERIRVSNDVMLIDVMPLPGAAGRSAFAAVLREMDGKIVVRYPESDRESALYRRVLASANAGVAAAENAARAAAPPPVDPNTPTPVPTPSQPTPPRGPG